MIRDAHVVVATDRFDDDLTALTTEHGFRVDAIYPADAPSTAIVSAHGVRLRLERAPHRRPVELHLIGQRVEPALAELDAYLDRALLANRTTVRVVHGHGSGRLRKAVREHLRGHRAVSAHRPGEPDEGGDGATVVTLRG